MAARIGVFILRREDQSDRSDLLDLEEETQECVATWIYGRKFVERF